MIIVLLLLCNYVLSLGIAVRTNAEDLTEE